jgi:hypothetical protein
VLCPGYATTERRVERTAAILSRCLTKVMLQQPSQPIPSSNFAVIQSINGQSSAFNLLIPQPLMLPHGVIVSDVLADQIVQVLFGWCGRRQGRGFGLVQSCSWKVLRCVSSQRQKQDGTCLSARSTVMKPARDNGDEFLAVEQLSGCSSARTRRHRGSTLPGGEAPRCRKAPT